MVRLFATTLAVMSCVSVSYAQNAPARTAGEYRAFCEAFVSQNTRLTSVETAKAGQCIGAILSLAYVGGVLDQSLRFCVPDDVPLGKTTKIILDYIDSHPSERDAPFPVIVVKVLHEKMPCP